MTFNLTRSFQIQIESPYFEEYIHLILINLALTGWILFVVTFYDRLLALLLGRLLLTRYIKSKRVKSSLGSISFGIFGPRLVVRDLKIQDLGHRWSFVIDQFEIGLNQLKNSLLDRKLFHIKLSNFQLVLDETAADSNYCQINQLFQLNLFENSILDFENLSILVYNSASLKSFHLRISRLGLVWSRTSSDLFRVSDFESTPFNPNEIVSQISTKSCDIQLDFCENFLKRPKLISHRVVSCNDMRIKSSLFKSMREYHIGPGTSRSVNLFDIKFNNIEINIELVGKLTQLYENLRTLLTSAIYKFNIKRLELSLYLDAEMVLKSRSTNVFGRASRDLVAAKLSRTKIYSLFNKLPFFECESIELNSSRRSISDLHSIELEFKDRSIIRLENMFSLFQVLKFPPFREFVDFELKIQANGLLIDLVSPLSTGRVTFKLKSRHQIESKEKQALLLIEHPKLTDPNKQIEISVERITVELKTETGVNLVWQAITSPIRIGRFKDRVVVKNPSVTASLNSNQSSLDSYLYTYVVDDESDFEQSMEEIDENHKESESSLDLSCLYVSVIQLRVEIPHVKALNPKRYELIIGDIFGTIDADHFLTSFDSFYQTFTFFFDEFNRFNKFNKTENSQQLVLRIISSLTHINLINNSSLFNLVMSPLDYARCHSHDMLVLPDANLGLFVCVGRPGHTAPGKYTDFIDCGAISVKYSILKRIKQEKILPECICITNENDFLHTAKPYEFGKNESLFTKPCIYKNENRFGQSLLVKNEPTFYSHREFIPEYSSRQNRRITDTLHVVSCLEESTSSAESKSRFQPFEIYVYEDGLNLFLNEFYHDRNQTKPASSVHVSHMTPPYFSADFKLYIRFLPIIRNLTRCTSAILDRNISIEWPVRHSAVHSDLAHESSGKSNRRKSLWPFDTRKKSSALIDEEKQSGRYKFSIGQLNPEYKLKPSKHESMLSDKRLRVEEVFVESVIDDVRRVNEDDSQDEFEAMSVEFPNNDLASNQVVLFLSFVNWRITGCTSSMDISKPKQSNMPDDKNRFYLKRRNLNRLPSENSSFMMCVYKLIVVEKDEQENEIEAKNIMIYPDRTFYSVEKSIKIEEISVKIENNTLSLGSLLKIYQFNFTNDYFMDLSIKQFTLICPDRVSCGQFNVDFLYDRSKNYLEIKQKMNILKPELSKRSLKNFFEFITEIGDSLADKLPSELNYNIEIRLDKFEAQLELDNDNLLCFNVESSNFNASNRFLVPTCRFKMTTSGQVDLTRRNANLGSIDFCLEKNVLDARAKLRVRRGGHKFHLSIELPVLSNFELTRRETHIGQLLVTISNHNDLVSRYHALLIDLTGINATLSSNLSQIVIECDLVRGVQTSELNDILDIEL